jgi:phosphoglycerate dehydrogenase-like enzyme
MKLLVMYSNSCPSSEHIKQLKSIKGVNSVDIAQSEEEAIQHASDAQVILGHRYLYQTLPHTHCLDWIQSTAGGIDHLINDDLLRLHPLLSRCPISSQTVALHALAITLAVLRRVPDAVRSQNKGIWSTPFKMLPTPQTAMVLGMGMIGRSIATTLRNQGLRVWGMNRSTSPEVLSACDQLLTGNAWLEFLPRVDLLFIALPLTPETRNLVNTQVMAALPDHAVITNVSRGGVLDTDALVEHLRHGKLGGAALDLIDPVPSSRDDPIWQVPDLLITPKVAAHEPHRQAYLEKFVEQQVARYSTGARPEYLVDYAATYGPDGQKT